jgi:flagellar biosynthesis protein FlhG
MTLLVDQASRLRAIVGDHPPPRHAAARRAHVIAIASGKGGVGKTTLAVNLGVTLAESGKNVVLLDADLGLGNADILLGVPSGRHLGAVLAGQRTIHEIAVQPYPRLRVIPGGSGVASLAHLDDASRRRLIDALAPLERSADVLLLDCGAGVGPLVLELIALADLALIVTNPEPTAVADAYALIKSTVTREPRPGEGALRLIVNQVRSHSEGAEVHARVAAVADRFLGYRLRFSGSVSADVRVPQAVRSRHPVVLAYPRTSASRDVRSLSASIALQFASSRADMAESPPRGSRLWSLLAGVF